MLGFSAELNAYSCRATGATCLEYNMGFNLVKVNAEIDRLVHQDNSHNDLRCDRQSRSRVMVDHRLAQVITNKSRGRLHVVRQTT